MTLYSPITVDLYNPYPLKVMNIPQYNTGRGALITLTAAGSVIVPDKETLYIYAKKPDGTMVYASCELLGAQVRASFDEQMTAVAGVLDVEIQMVDASGNSITTTIFQINIMASNIDYARIVSSDDFIALRDALAMVSGIGDHTQLATENKSSLVAAVNELHTELEQQNVNLLRVKEYYITLQYSSANVLHCSLTHNLGVVPKACFVKCWGTIGTIRDFSYFLTNDIPNEINILIVAFSASRWTPEDTMEVQVTLFY